MTYICLYVLCCWKRPWCWERLKTGGGGDDRGWDGWMAPPTQGTWVWVSCGSWWWTGRPGVLQSMGRKEADRTERLNWTEPFSSLNWNELSHFLETFFFFFSKRTPLLASGGKQAFLHCAVSLMRGNEPIHPMMHNENTLHSHVGIFLQRPLPTIICLTL